MPQVRGLVSAAFHMLGLRIVTQLLPQADAASASALAFSIGELLLVLPQITASPTSLMSSTTSPSMALTGRATAKSRRRPTARGSAKPWRKAHGEGLRRRRPARCCRAPCTTKRRTRALQTCSLPAMVAASEAAGWQRRAAGYGSRPAAHQLLDQMPRTRKKKKVSNIIFVDSPAGTGFSYDTTQGTIPSDTTVVHQLRIFLETWFDEHQQFLANPLYITGDSYSGIIIPSLAMEIAKGIESGDERLINLKGVIAGNPVTDIRLDDNGRLPFLHGMGIIPDELYELARKSCGGEYRSPSNAACANSLQAIKDCIRDLNGVHVLEPSCREYPDLSIVQKKQTMLPDNGTKRSMLESAALSSVCRNSTYFLSEVWTNDEAVRETLGIHKGTVPLWQRCDFHLPYTKEISSTVGEHLALITRGYRSMVYSGDHDSKVSYVGTQAWIRQLNLSIKDDWRPWYVDSQVAGFTRAYSNNFTYATVKGAGHTAPEYMPRECLAMIDRWLSGHPL